MSNNYKPCPFCGSRNLKAFARLSGRYDQRYYNAQVHCMKCGARGPVARTEGYIDARYTSLSKQDEEKLFKLAFRKFYCEEELENDLFSTIG